MNENAKIRELEAQVKRLQKDCAEAYQAFDHLSFYFDDDECKDCEKILDNLAAAANGDPRPHDDLHPWPRGKLTYVPDDEE